MFDQQEKKWRWQLLLLSGSLIVLVFDPVKTNMSSGLHLLHPSRRHGFRLPKPFLHLLAIFSLCARLGLIIVSRKRVRVAVPLICPWRHLVRVSTCCHCSIKRNEDDELGRVFSEIIDECVCRWEKLAFDVRDEELLVYIYIMSMWAADESAALIFLVLYILYSICKTKHVCRIYNTIF